MFPKPAQVLKAREGSLSEVPLPLLLHALAAEERSAVLELKVRQLEKRIRFEDGHPVACRSNLLHETLGKYLVDKGRLPEAEYQKALAESIQSGEQMGTLLVKKALLSPYELYRQLQANLAQKVLDCFRWTEGRYRLLGDDGEEEGASIRMNPAQLLLTGITTGMPFDAVATHFAFTDERRFAWTPEHAPYGEGLKLTPREARLVKALEGQPTFGVLQEKTGLDTEALLRRLYALAVMGLVHFADALPPAPPRPAPAPLPAPPAAAAAPPSADEDEAERNALLAAFLGHRQQDPFALLGVGVDVAAPALRRAFLAYVERYGPARFRTPELKEKAEALLVAAARAFAALAEPDGRALWTKRRQASEEKARGSGRPSTAEQFRIRTDLLDASAQLEEGRRRMAAENWRGALEQFEYACDIDPRPLHRAWRAWARYLVNPASHGRLALSELEDVLRGEPGLAQAHFWAGEVYRGLSNPEAAEACYRRAYKLEPGLPQCAERLQELARRARR